MDFLKICKRLLATTWCVGDYTALLDTDRDDRWYNK